jgi:uncharacterized protein (DUF1697 family)
LTGGAGEGTRIALLRAVNVGGRTPVAMADLRALLTGLGFADVRTVLQSGNLVFGAAGTDAGALEARLERELAARLGVATDVLVRTAGEWRALVAANPFPAEAQRDPARLVAVVLKAKPPAGAAAALRAAIVGRERVEVRGREAYAVYPDGQGRSKLTLPLIEKHLACRATARNWNTVLKLAALAGA